MMVREMMVKGLAHNRLYPPILQDRRDVPAALMFVVEGIGFRFGASVPADSAVVLRQAPLAIVCRALLSEASDSVPAPCNTGGDQVELEALLMRSMSSSEPDRSGIGWIDPSRREQSWRPQN
jgi:hypothetical protein